MNGQGLVVSKACLMCVQSLQSFKFNLELRKKSTLLIYHLHAKLSIFSFPNCQVLLSCTFLLFLSRLLSVFLPFIPSFFFSVYFPPHPLAFLSQREDTFPCIPHDTGHLERQKEREMWVRQVMNSEKLLHSYKKKSSACDKTRSDHNSFKLLTPISV